MLTQMRFEGPTYNIRSRRTPSKLPARHLFALRINANHSSALLRSYIEDFRAQHYQYESHREIFMAAPSSATDTGLISLRDLIDFISHVSDCYPDICKDFPQQLIDMLMQHHLVLETELREKLVGSLVLLKKKDIIDSER